MTRPEKIEEKVARAIPQPPEDFSDEQIAKAVLDALSVEDLLGLLEEKQGPTPDLIVARNALEAIKAEWAKNRSKDQPHDALNRVCGIANDALLKLDTAAELRGSYAMQAVARAALAAHSGSTGAAERVAEALRRLIEWFEQPRASSSGNTLSQIVVEARAALAAHQQEPENCAVRGDLHGTPVEWPERQPMDPAGSGTPQAQPGRVRQQERAAPRA